jgi:hypothetical protein
MSNPQLSAIVLWFLLVMPSLLVVQKYTGWSGTFVYMAVAALGVAFRRRLPAPTSKRATAMLGAGTVALVLVAFLIVYPKVNVHTAGAGSDDDDAHDVGAIALLHGRTPYAERTYLGNRLHQLPGAFVLAAPFVLLGTSALQNLFWLTVFFLVVAKETRDSGGALHLAWLVLLLGLGVMHQIATGTAYMSNAISVLVGLWWITRGGPDYVRILAAAFWGLTLASRPNWLMLVPLAFGWLWQHDGSRTAVRSTAIVCATAALLTVPFYLAAPDFGPLEAANRLTRFDAVVPYSGEALLIGMAALACWLSLKRLNVATLFAYCAAVQAFPVLAGAALGSWQLGRPDLTYAAYGTFAAWFALMAVALAESGSNTPLRSRFLERESLPGFC